MCLTLSFNMTQPAGKEKECCRSLNLVFFKLYLKIQVNVFKSQNIGNVEGFVQVAMLKPGDI